MITSEFPNALKVAGRLIAGAMFTALLAGAADAEILSVSTERAIVREGPGSGYPILWEARRLMPFQILSWHNEWARVRGSRGEAGWIHRSVLADAPTVVVLEKFANIRTGPGLNYPVAWTAARRYPLNVLKEDGEWLGVSAETGAEGWVFRKLVWGRTETDAPEEK